MSTKSRSSVWHTCSVSKVCRSNLLGGVQLILCTDISTATGAEIYGPHTYVVNVNSSIIGLTRYPGQFVHNFCKLQRAGCVSEFVSVYINNHHCMVLIASDGGCICCPMIIVDKGLPRVATEHILVSPHSMGVDFCAHDSI